MIPIEIEPSIKEALPNYRVAAIFCKVKNTEHNELLWQEIDALCSDIKSNYKMADVNKLPNIVETRQGYKTLGKEPNRYRPSAEALHRRILKGYPLYKVSTLVDLVNLVSMKTGYSIGGFDADKVQGSVKIGVGRENEKYEGIGRGLLNIHNMLILRDNVGGIGTQTSDEERTKIDLSTTNFYMNINDYASSEMLDRTVDWSVGLLKKYCAAEEIEVTRIQ